MGSGGTPPSGTVTFLFTDVEGSTGLWQLSPAPMRGAMARHDELVRTAIAGAGGTVFSTGGDSFAAAFGRADDAIAAAVAMQTALQAEDWPDGVELRVRIGVHTGEADERGGDYFGPAVNRAARVMAAAHGGQVLVTLATEEIVRDELPPGTRSRAVGEVALRGFDRSERVFQLVVDALPMRSFPPLPGAGGRPGNLPTPATSFRGREEELAHLFPVLERSRLVTLVGPGGVGKTRLAIEAAARTSERFPDGVWFCELAPVVEGGGAVHAIAFDVGAPLREGTNLVEQLVAGLRGRRALLVLDNCEHLLDDVAAIVEALVAGWSEGSMLCTSREGLGPAGEQLWPVGGIGEAGAALFLDRARALVPDFAPDDAGLAAIDGICRRLDGIPLAIELAAARVRTLAPEEIGARLADRFRLLRGSARGRVERHQTLQNTVSWSYNLLNAPEQRLFERLSVFAGGFDVAAAEAVCADEAIDEADVLDLLDSLVDKSMVTSAPGGRIGRFSMLETLRQFAADLLAGRGGSDLWRDRHAGHYAAMTTSLMARCWTPEEPAVWAAFDLEWDNLRAAFEHGLATGDADVLAAIPGTMGLFALFSDRAEVGPWARDAIESGALEGHPAEPDVRGAWAVWEYWYAADVPATARALAYGDDAAARTYGASTTVALASFMVAHARGDGPTADAITRSWLSAPDGLLGEVLARGDRAVYGSWFGDESVDRASMGVAAARVADETGSPSICAWARVFHGISLARGDPATAANLLEEGRRRLGPLAERHWLTTVTLVWHFTAAMQTSATAELRDIAMTTLAQSRAMRFRMGLVLGLINAAIVVGRGGEVEVAARLLGAGEAHLHAGPGGRVSIADARAVVDAGLGADAEAAVAAGAALGLDEATDLALAALEKLSSP